MANITTAMQSVVRYLRGVIERVAGDDLDLLADRRQFLVERLRDRFAFSREEAEQWIDQHVANT